MLAHYRTARLIIFTAVRLEAKAIAKALGGKWNAGDRPFLCRDTQPPTQVYTIGIGASRLKVERPGEAVAGIILAGLAGALDPSLHTGDLILDGLGGDVDLSPLPMSIHRGRIHTSARIVGTPEAKADLFQSTQARAVDMEADEVRKLAVTLGVPFLHLRSISDTADASIDPTLLKFIDDVGRVKPMALAGMVLRRPALVSRLKRLGADANLAATNMADLLRLLLVPDSTGAGSSIIGEWLRGFTA